jgi:ABC-type multidrug transport system fused ATPase/permease subunit
VASMAKKLNNDLPKAKLTKSSMKRAMRIFTFMGDFKGRFILGLFFLLLTSATALIFPSLMGDLVDSAKKTMFEDINKVALWLMLLFLAQAVFSFFRIYLFSQVTEFTLQKLRQSIYNHLIQLPMSFFSTNRVGEINSRVSADISQIQDTFTTTLAEFLRQFIIIIGGIILISITSIELTLFMLALFPVMVVIAVVFGRYIRKISKQVQEKVAESNTIVEETMQGIASVKAFANEFIEVGRYRKSTIDITTLSLKNAKMRGFFASFIIFCLFGAIVAVIWYAVRLVKSGELTEGEMFAFILYTTFVGASIGGIAELYTQIQKAVGATERVLDILDEKKEDINIAEIKVKAERVKGHVIFDNVAFNYPNRSEISVLKNVSFEALPGEKIALVGPSGAGKSTITSLLLRFYDPTGGTIKIDGKPSVDYQLTELRNQMAIVPQDVILFGGSIRENIAYGKPEATMEEIIEAAEKANARAFIESFPEKYDTLVGERGITLSGGQRQRIAIARAVLKDPCILILDEATSSLDSESERLVQEALNKLMIGRTSFIVAHRLSTIRNADKIVVIANGNVAETGSHDQLIANSSGVYHHLYKLQYSRQEEPGLVD